MGNRQKSSSSTVVFSHSCINSIDSGQCGGKGCGEERRRRENTSVPFPLTNQLFKDSGVADISAPCRCPSAVRVVFLMCTGSPFSEALSSANRALCPEDVRRVAHGQ